MDDPRAGPDERPPKAVEIVVRQGRAEDLEPAFELWRRVEAARRRAPPPPISASRVRGYARRAGAFLVVADSARDGLVGMALVTPPEPRPSEEVAALQMVFVDPERWGEGVGGRLVAAALAEARARGFGRARLWAHADDERARRLYEGRGFGRSGPRVAGESGEPIVPYERPL